MWPEPDDIERFSGSLFARMQEAREQLPPRLELVDVAEVESVGSGVARVRGFHDLYADEMVWFEDGTPGIAASLRRDRAGIVVLGDTANLAPGQRVRRSRRAVEVPVGNALLGRVIDATGRPLDGGGVPRCDLRRPIERPAPPILARAPVSTPLQTGIKPVDAAIHIGLGQRELDLGRL